jgi:hypothetical protein
MFSFNNDYTLNEDFFALRNNHMRFNFQLISNSYLSSKKVNHWELAPYIEHETTKILKFKLLHEFLQ